MQHVDVIARIQELCRERGWTYYRLARAAGIPTSALDTMRRKTNTPTVPTRMKLWEGSWHHPGGVFRPLRRGTGRGAAALAGAVGAAG